jgi:hypothetical protein
VSTQPRSLLGGERCIFENGRSLLSEGGMVYEPSQIRPMFHKCSQHMAVQGAGTFRLNRAKHGKTGKLVAESDRVRLHLEQAASASFIECPWPRAQQGFNQPGFSPPGRYCDELGKLARGGQAARQPRDHGIPHGFRNKLTPTRKYLAHEERIAAGDLMKESGVPATVSRKHFDCREREGCQAHTNDMMAGEFAECQADRMICGKLVIAISSYEDRSRSLNTPADESQKVERRRISPMEVFEHNNPHMLGSCEFLEEEAKEPVTRFVIACIPPIERRCLCGNLVDWGKRPWRGEPVACTPKCACLAPMLRREPLNQGALAEPRFTRDEDELARRRACLPEAPVEFIELLLALEKVHERSIIGHNT